MRVDHIERRIEQQIILKELIDNAYGNFAKVGYSNVTSYRVQARLASLNENWSKFSVIHDAIVLSMTKLSLEEQSCLRNLSYFSENFFSSTHECYLEAVEKISSLLDSENQVTRTPSTPSESQTSGVPVFFHHARLPRIDIPKFNGSPADWLSFKDLFSSLILANPTLTAVEKLQYLKTSLIGSASHLLKNTTLTADNFQKAWDALISFYENKRLLVNAALHSLVTLKRMTKESANEMEQLYTGIMQIYRTLETLHRPVETWDDFLVFLAVQRLDSESVKAWEHHLGPSKDPPTWKQFSEFLITRLLSLQAFEKSRTGKSSQSAIKSHFQGKAKEGQSSKANSCVICSGNQYVPKCPQYSSKTIQQRVAIITKHRLCYNCLGSHRVSACRITTRCQKCGQKHHTTIHQHKGTTSDTGINPDNSPVTNPKSTEAHVLHAAKQSKPSMSSIFLATAQVDVIAPNNETLRARALIDQGSEISLISERIAQVLRLPRTRSSIPLVGIGGKKSNKTRGIVFFKFRPHFNSNSELSMTAHILPKLTDTIPSIQIEQRNWHHLDGLQLADKDFAYPNSIDLILGADIYGQIIESGLVKADKNSPIAQRTKLGWIISGVAGSRANLNKIQGYHVSLNRELHDLIARFWESEEVSTTSTSSLSREAQECEQHFLTTHSRDADGRYVVQLPFKKPTNSLGDSRSKAGRILNNLSKRLKNEPAYSSSYSAFMKEYESLNHMKRVPDDETEPPLSFYLPHHGVVREGSLTTKLRVVFNGSSRSSTGVSLNDLLHTGAKLQLDLFDVIIWFRQFRYVFSTDVEKMYRQIKVHPTDWNFQRILWLDESHHTVTYQLTTVTYGLACAPFLALRVLNQLVSDEGSNFPLAVPILQRGRYVDDLFGGSNSIHHAREIVRQLDQLCMAGGFPLQKWISNNSEILDPIPAGRRVNSPCLQIEDTTAIQVLGLCWKPVADNFQFTINLSSSPVMTKRSVLSTIARLFDPLGLISPVIIPAKIFIQELWTIKIDWDDSLPPHLSSKWIKFIDQLKTTSNLTFPRWLNTQSKQPIEMHGFCDASQQAVSAVIYIRTSNDQGETISSLVCSKTKVAPLKRMTVPRLELTGAVLLTKLMSHVLRILELATSPVYMWTDSAVAYTWINNHPSRWKDFVYNRVCFIQETVPQATWKFVPGTENPADCATRGLTPSQLSEHLMWWTGPQWLSQSPSTWPKYSQLPSHKDNLEERPTKSYVITKAQSMERWNLINRYSSLTRLLRVTCWCLRAIRIFKKQSENSITGPITIQELEGAKHHWVKITQQS
ncbi:uncharacterized protein LOC105256226 [Camponotus floridanus]|uniref:uncharacterized protein LOC105256226 n=1 Tax=Camponotus floridanus TaxID=104421 RepID=UPI000DC6C6B7|nr:uncharacterized protein LOC105256226 [Camponotus floridanus]